MDWHNYLPFGHWWFQKNTIVISSLQVLRCAFNARRKNKEFLFKFKRNVDCFNINWLRMEFIDAFLTLCWFTMLIWFHHWNYTSSVDNLPVRIPSETENFSQITVLSNIYSNPHPKLITPLLENPQPFCWHNSPFCGDKERYATIFFSEKRHYKIPSFNAASRSSIPNVFQ